MPPPISVKPVEAPETTPPMVRLPPEATLMVRAADKTTARLMVSVFAALSVRVPPSVRELPALVKVKAEA